MCSTVESKPTGLGNNTSNLAGTKPKRTKLYNIRSLLQDNRINGGVTDSWVDARHKVSGNKIRVDKKTGEFYHYDKDSEGDYIRNESGNYERFPVDDISNVIDLEIKNQYHRCFRCGRTPYKETVGFAKHVEHDSAGTTGVMRCGSVWRCPVCRDKIIQERAKELEAIESYWRDEGGKMYMMTLTIPHFRGETAGKVYGSSADGTGLSGCITKLRQSALWSKHFKKKTGYVADVRIVETNVGIKNGYHIHVHMMIYTESEIDVGQWEPQLRNKWNEIIKKVTGKTGNDHSLKLDQWKSGSEYLAKWGSAAELTSDSAKSAKNGNVTISELEYALVDDTTLERTGFKRNHIKQILKQYYADMDGQRLMQWGGKKGFKNEIIEEKTDQEIVDDDHDHIKEISISGTDYTNEIYNKGRLSTVLNIYENLGKRGLIAYLNDHNIKYQEPFKFDQDIRETCSMVHLVSKYLPE